MLSNVYRIYPNMFVFYLWIKALFKKPYFPDLMTMRMPYNIIQPVKICLLMR